MRNEVGRCHQQAEHEEHHDLRQPGKAVVHAEDVLQGVHRAVCGTLPALCGGQVSYFREIDTGAWIMDGTEGIVPEPIKFELRLSLYDDRSLACASFNVHGDFFARRLDYLGEEGHEAPIWTSCAAFGLERWVWAVLVQHGPRVQDWPAELRALV